MYEDPPGFCPVPRVYAGTLAHYEHAVRPRHTALLRRLKSQGSTLAVWMHTRTPAPSGPTDVARNVIGSHATQETRISECVSMTWRALGGRYSLPRHEMVNSASTWILKNPVQLNGLTQETRV